MRILSNGSIIPESFKVQQYNNNVDIRRFEIPRYYKGNTIEEDITSDLYDTNKVDLSLCKVCVRLNNPDDKVVMGNTLTITNLLGEDILSDDDDVIAVNWILTNSITTFSGKRKYQLEFYKEDGTLAFRTQLANITCNSSLDTEANISQSYPSIFERFEEKLNSISSSYDVYVANTTDNPVKTETQWLASLKGETGPSGADGQDGADGQGVKNGGTTCQILVKNSNTDYDTKWSTLILKGTSVPSSLEEEQLFLLYK